MKTPEQIIEDNTDWIKNITETDGYKGLISLVSDLLLEEGYGFHYSTCYAIDLVSEIKNQLKTGR